MGGFGSGNRYRFRKKTTVERSLAVEIRDFRSKLGTNSGGTLTWGNKSSVHYFVTSGDGWATVTLHYRWDSEDVRIPIALQTTPMQFGGNRWWFTCPLIVGGVACNRRCGKLYLPPGSRYFGCRTCHGLTYRSCQESHQLGIFEQIEALERYANKLKQRRPAKP